MGEMIQPIADDDEMNLLLMDNIEPSSTCEMALPWRAV